MKRCVQNLPQAQQLTVVDLISKMELEKEVEFRGARLYPPYRLSAA